MILSLLEWLPNPFYKKTSEKSANAHIGDTGQPRYQSQMLFYHRSIALTRATVLFYGSQVWKHAFT